MNNDLFAWSKKARRMRLFEIILFILLSCLIPIPSNALETLTILYTGSILGEVKPCGCSEEGDMGGMLRRATIIDKERSSNKNILLLDAGDSFKEPTEQGKLKAKTLIQAMDRLGYDAALPGEKDFIYGEDIFNKAKFSHWILSNVENANLNQEKTLKYFLKDLNEGTKIAVIGLIGPELFYSKGQGSVKVESPLIELNKLVLKLKAREKTDIIILLVHMEKEKAKELFNHKDIDIIINGHLSEEERIVEPEISGTRIMVHARERGQFLGKITSIISNRKIQNISNEYIPLTPEIADSQLVQALYDTYNDETKQLFLKWLKGKKNVKNGPFITVDGCKECHTEAYTVWEKSRHAHALGSLKKANKTFDPDCLLCHTTGFKQEGGFLEESMTPKLSHVQCEVCHGFGKNHVADQSKPYGMTSEDICLNCHTRENSPGFDYSTYWPKIRH